MTRRRRLIILLLLAGGCDSGSSSRGTGDLPTPNPATGNSDSGAPAPPALEVLKRPPFVPRDLALFARTFFRSAPADPSPTAAPTEAAVRTLLSQTLGRRQSLAPADASATVALFDDPALQAVIAAPSLRAALLLNRGTAGDAAIAAVRAGAFVEISFGDAPAFFGDTPAWVELVNGRLAIRVSRWAAGEDPRVLAAVLAHETLHADDDVQSKEEVICAALEAIIHGQLVLESPEIATAGGRLSRLANTRLLERLNSRDERGQLRLFFSTAHTLPRSQAGFGAFADYYQPFFARPTAGNPTLSAMVQAVTGRAAPGGFDNALCELLDAHQVALSPTDLVRLAEILNLDTSPATPLPVPDRPRSSQPPPTAPTASPDEAAAQQTLRLPPFRPRTPALLNPGLYEASPPGDFSRGQGLTGPAARELVRNIFTGRHGASDARTSAALAAFDGPLATRVPEPTLRAALLMLRGTIADTAIEAVLSGVWSGIEFIDAIADLPQATALPPAPAARPAIGVNGLLRGEDPLLIAPLIAEAALHEDAQRTPKESLVGQAILPIVYGQLLLETPTLARRGTLLARQLNGLLFGRLNSRDAEGRLRLTASQGNIFPGSLTNVGSYLGVFIPFGPDTPGGVALWDMVSAITGDTGFQGPFSVGTVRLLEDRQMLWSAQQIVALLRALDADLP